MCTPVQYFLPSYLQSFIYNLWIKSFGSHWVMVSIKKRDDLLKSCFHLHACLQIPNFMFSKLLSVWCTGKGHDRNHSIHATLFELNWSYSTSHIFIFAHISVLIAAYTLTTYVYLDLLKGWWFTSFYSMSDINSFLLPGLQR